MLTSKVFTCGNSQTVRIPKEFQLEEAERFIKKANSFLILISKKTNECVS